MNSVANYEVLRSLSGTLLYVSAYMRRKKDTIIIKVDTGYIQHVLLQTNYSWRSRQMSVEYNVLWVPTIPMTNNLDKVFCCKYLSTLQYLSVAISNLSLVEEKCFCPTFDFSSERHAEIKSVYILNSNTFYFQFNLNNVWTRYLKRCQMQELVYSCGSKSGT